MWLTQICPLTETDYSFGGEYFIDVSLKLFNPKEKENSHWIPLVAWYA
jgi:hypothetical protein